MAEAVIAVKCLDGVMECPICTEVYTDSRVLPCIHTYCLKCITRWGEDKNPGERLACPLCMEEFEVPAGGLKAAEEFLHRKATGGETAWDVFIGVGQCEAM